jgi:predicted O-methyltransferase YrrM
MEKRAAKEGFPAIGPLVGRTCAVLAKSIRARRVFEVGSGFGYSTFWFARAVGEQGEVVHTETSPDLSIQARSYLARAKLAGRVDFRLGDGVELLARDEETWDVVFIDCEKAQYPDAWECAVPRVKKGGYILADNTLWSGKVADKAVKDKATKAIRAYNKAALADAKFLTTILPLRDGLTVSLRVE